MKSYDASHNMTGGNCTYRDREIALEFVFESSLYFRVGSVSGDPLCSGTESGACEGERFASSSWINSGTIKKAPRYSRDLFTSFLNPRSRIQLVLQDS